jgi:aryl-alcohol dehydrogenase-like predicted oxidoreductase
MQYTRLGNTGLAVSRMALGMMTYGTPQWRAWVLDEAAARPLVQRAVELGFNFFDTADVYSAGESEVLTGRFVREFCRRDEVVVATKVFHAVQLDAEAKVAPNKRGLSRKRLFHAVDESLKRLGLDYIDLYQIHRFDARTPIEETMEALHDIVRSGKVRYLGASSMWAWQFARMQDTARRHGWTPFCSMQNHYNLAYREEEREMIPLCRDQGVALIPWSPLARGFLAGNRKAGDAAAGGATTRASTDDLAQGYYYRPSDFATVERLGAAAAARGVSAATLAYAWLLHRPGITAPIIGASKPYQLDDAVKAMDIALSADDMAALEAGYEPHPVLGHS